jgi:hypothetical protein
VALTPTHAHGRKRAMTSPNGWSSVVVGTGVDPVTFRFSGIAISPGQTDEHGNRAPSARYEPYAGAVAGGGGLSRPCPMKTLSGTECGLPADSNARKTLSIVLLSAARAERLVPTSSDQAPGMPVQPNETYYTGDGMEELEIPAPSGFPLYSASHSSTVS